MEKNIRGCLQLIHKISHAIVKLRETASRSIENFGAQYIAFGIFGVLNYPIFYLIWQYYSYQSYESFALRLTATVLCILLLLRKYWPQRLQPWFALFWMGTLLFCLPFFFFFMMLKNNGAPVWLMSANTIIFWLVLMVDWESYIIIFLLGISAAIALYLLTTSNKLIFSSYSTGVIAQLVGSFVVVSFFARNKQRFDVEKLNTMKSLGATVAHELRTPLVAIQMGVSGTKDYLPSLVKAYNAAKEHNIEVDPIQPKHLQILNKIFENIESEVSYSHTIINMILMNVKQDVESITDFKLYSMRECIEEALDRYPFKPRELELVSFDRANDFKFYGDKTLMIHVLFNLLKNSLYYIQAARKGKIEIWLKKENDKNILYFKDTGQGIPSEIVQKLFEKFYTTTYHGTGLGLAFCKMVLTSFGGSISCTSIYGEFAQFKMSFPVKSEET